MVDQFAEGDGADVVGAYEPQAGEALGLIELRCWKRRGRVDPELAHALAPIFGSSPFMRRLMFDRCFHKRSAVMMSARIASGRWSVANSATGIGEACHERRQRRVAGQRRDAEPDGAEEQGCRPKDASQHADVGRDALAALEVEPDGKEMAQEGAQSGEKSRVDGEAGVRPADPMCHEHGDGALHRIEQKRQSREALVSGPQNVGGADVSRADLAHVAQSGGPGEQIAEGDRSQEIAERREARVPERPFPGFRALVDHVHAGQRRGSWARK